MKYITSLGLLTTTLFLTSCIIGNYRSEQTLANSSALTCNSIAPMKLNTMRRVTWTRYKFTNSYANPYEEYARWRKKGDTLYMMGAIYNGEDKIKSKEYTPTFLIQGDTLVSLRADCSNYVKGK